MSMPSSELLLAKSAATRRAPPTLEQHLIDTETAANLLFRERSRWLSALVRFFRLSHPGSATRFRIHIRIAALAHDIGKANADFQRAMRDRGSSQTLRHEHLSTLFLHHPAVIEWFRSSNLDHDAICAAVLSHHLKAAAAGEYAFCQTRTAPDVLLRFNDEQVVRTLRRMANVAGTSPPIVAPLPQRFSDALWVESLRSAKLAARRFGREEGDRRCLALALKAGVIAADSVASALVREGYSISEWVEEAAHAPALRPEDVRADLIQPRIAQIEARSGRAFVPHRFQLGAADLPRRALLLAGCGAGKTLAAWHWAERQLATSPAGRIVFLYPTRGTATEGFRDYVGWAPEGKAELLHGTARYEIEGLMENPPESLRGKVLVDEAQARLFALGLWPKRYFSATVDQFLSFLEHRYESLCLLPALADSLLILDEIHSYDSKMLAELLDFLEHFDIPVLAMTATLPPSRREQLVARGLRLYPQTHERTELADLEREEAHPRYRLVPCVDVDDAFARVMDEVRLTCRRVLWVVNVVGRCQKLARRLMQELGESRVLVYHSRFRLEDRRRAHQRVIDAFQLAADAGLVAVTTQVCEMSLDLDADVLVSEHAPIPSLVQRFGRANRNPCHGEDFRAELLLYEPESRAPYDDEDFAGIGPFLDALPSEPSQRDLAFALEQHARRERRAAEEVSGFLFGGYYAVPGEFRDVDEFGRRCILDRDIEAALRLLEERRPIDGLVLNVPKRWVKPQPLVKRLPRWLGVASSVSYCERLGFEEPERPT